MRKRVKVPRSVGVLVAAFLLAIAAIPLASFGADHLDAPSLTSPGARGELDVNDIYVFEGEDAGNTVLVMTVNPNAGALGTAKFGSDVIYQMKIDTNGDAVEDIAYKFRFGAPRADGTQRMHVKLAKDKRAMEAGWSGGILVKGYTEDIVTARHGRTVFAGVRSDPFFFDLGGFLGSVEGQGPRMFNDGSQSDPFATFNTMAIVLELPDHKLGDDIGVWGTTNTRVRGTYTQIDRMGRPAINTVFSATVLGGGKNAFNQDHPADDVSTYTSDFVNRLVALTTVVGAPYTPAEAAGIVGLLLPDVLTYDTGTAAAGPLNGRNLADDVIDVELGIVTNGVVTTDSIPAHTDYLTSFPYLGPAH